MIFGLILPKGTVRYALMPDVLSRLHGLMAGGFHYLPYLLALVYRNFRLLPDTHPYLQARNMGKYGMRHVIAEAGNNLKFSVRNIDQLILYAVILCGIILLFLQFLSIGAFVFFSSAIAGPPDSWTDFFVIPALYRSQDLASIMLDMVFGVRAPDLITLGLYGGNAGLFESCAGIPSIPCTDLQLIPNARPDIDLSAIAGVTIPASEFSITSSDTTFPYAHHVGLHRMFSIYSNGLLVVAVGMVSYFIATILAETAQSGTPFGRRYNKTWVPFRIVMAFGLLMPLGSGLSSSQYIVLYAAKYGSAFASNGWYRFNDTLTQSTLGDIQNLISRPTVPDLGGFLQFMFVANVCEILYESVRDPASPSTPVYEIEAYIHGPETVAVGNTLTVAAGTSYDDVITQLGGKSNTVVITFGQKDATKYPKERGHVMPLCGQMRWILADPRDGTLITGAERGPYRIQSGYWELVKRIWFNESAISVLTIPLEQQNANRRDINFANVGTSETFVPSAVAAMGGGTNAEVGQVYKKQIEDNVKAIVETIYTLAVVEAILSDSWLGAWNGAAHPLYNKGWAAAGIWYNTIAELNGSVTVAAFNVPAPFMYPHIMEKVWETKQKFNKEIMPKDRFTPSGEGLDDISGYLGASNALTFATVLGQAFKAYNSVEVTTTHTKPSNSVIFDAITSLLGTNGLYDMRRNPDTHPLAQLVGVGRALVESAVRNLGYAAFATMAGMSMGNVLGEFAGQLGATAASMFVTIAMLGLTVGFVLFYILPFLPFIYFFFAVGGWIKGIFEALVGAPLWALAHIRIDAHGLPGNAALNGYFLIFEVFLRPILILFGLLASISIFSALVSVLNSVFPSVTSNIGGYNIESEITGVGPSTIDSMRGKVDQFFFTVIYAVLVYMMGMSSFKLIDTIPNNILRWMGASVATFNDQREDAAQGLVSKATVGSQQSLGRIGGGLQKIAGLAKG